MAASSSTPSASSLPFNVEDEKNFHAAFDELKSYKITFESMKEKGDTLSVNYLKDINYQLEKMSDQLKSYDKTKKDFLVRRKTGIPLEKDEDAKANDEVKLLGLATHETSELIVALRAHEESWKVFSRTQAEEKSKAEKEKTHESELKRVEESDLTSFAKQYKVFCIADKKFEDEKNDPTKNSKENLANLLTAFENLIPLMPAIAKKFSAYQLDSLTESKLEHKDTQFGKEEIAAMNPLFSSLPAEEQEMIKQFHMAARKIIKFTLVLAFPPPMRKYIEENKEKAGRLMDQLAELGYAPAIVKYAAAWSHPGRYTEKTKKNMEKYLRCYGLRACSLSKIFDIPSRQILFKLYNTKYSNSKRTFEREIEIVSYQKPLIKQRAFI